jgi:hypothetical protein
MSEVGVGRRRLKDINLIALFIIVGKKKLYVTSACQFSSGGSGVVQVKMS